MPTTVTQTLTGTQFAAITDFTDLWLEFKANRRSAIYAGPGDVVSGATRWVGLRAYMLSTVGTNAVRLRRDSDNSEQDFVTVLGGGLDLASISTFGGSANLFVTKFYDQAGTNHLVQTTAAQQAQFILSGWGALPITAFVSSAISSYVTSAIVAQNQPWTISTVARRTSNFTAAQIMWANFQSGSLQLRFELAANTLMMYAGTTPQTAAAADSVFHAIQGVFNSASSDINVDGTVNTVNAGTQTQITTSNMGSYDGSSFGLDGNILEMGEWSTAFTPTQSSSMSANQHSYWGF
jgi:hypothetical protein